MMGHRQVEQAALFYEFSLEKHVPPDHLLRSIDRFVELDEVRRELAGFYSHLGRPSIDPELMIRILIVGYCFGIRSERRLREHAGILHVAELVCEHGRHWSSVSVGQEVRHRRRFVVIGNGTARSGLRLRGWPLL